MDGDQIAKKLKSKARSEGVRTGHLLFRYLHERFMERLSRTAPGLVVKWGHGLNFVTGGACSRPTRDVDCEIGEGDGVRAALEAVRNAVVAAGQLEAAADGTPDGEIDPDKVKMGKPTPHGGEIKTEARIGGI